MQQDQRQQEDDTFQFSTLTIFDEDPLEPDISLLQPEIEVNYCQPYLLKNEQLISQTHFKIIMLTDCNKTKCNYQLVITSYRLIFYELGQTKQQFEINSSSIAKLPMSLPYGFIEEVDIIKKQIIIRAKSGLLYRVKPYTELKGIYQIILYGFTYIPFFTKHISEEEQAESYDSLAEMERMRISWEKYLIIPNNSGKLSSTYPKYFIIAKTISQSLLQECIKIRNYARIPALTYYHGEYNVGLWRGARPKINQQNNKFNKAYLKQISKDLVVIDLRDEQLSTKQKENKSESIFRKFQNLSSLNDILKKILIAYAKDESILKVISKWFKDVYQLIETAYLVTQNMQLRKQVLLQQNSGFDRVAQIAALAQLILDPFYRTIHGFNLLIQKDFISFGHPFAKRLGFQREKIEQSSPIFIQFLECVNQLLVTHPTSFQFSSFYIARVAYEAYSTKFNNFFYNSQKDRLNCKFYSKTPSIWKMDMRKQDYNYQWVEKQAVQPLNALRKTPSIREFMIWKQYYDLITKMTCQSQRQASVKQRKNSIYQLLQTSFLKKI